MKIFKMLSSLMVMAAAVVPLHLAAANFNMKVCAIGAPCTITYAGSIEEKLTPGVCADLSYDDSWSGMSVGEMANARFKGWFGLASDTSSLNIKDATVLLYGNLFIPQETIQSAKKYDGLPVIFPKFVPLRLVETAVEPVGAGSVSCSPASDNQRYEEGSTVTLTATANDGYAFKCWKMGDTQNPYTFTVGNADAIYTAVFTGKEYKLTVRLNGDDAEYRGETRDQTLSEPLVVGATNLNNIGVATRNGYVFSGWYSSKSGDVKIYDEYGHNCECTYWTKKYPEGTFRGNSDLEVYAWWEPLRTTITLENGDGSTGGTNSVQVVFGKPMPKIACPTKRGHRFLGYYSKPEGQESEQYYDKDGTGIRPWNGCEILYAHWEIIRCKVTFDANHPSGSCVVSLSTNEMQIVSGGSFGELATAVCMPTFYDFAGWWTDPVGGSEITADSPVPETDINLYAHWTTNSYYIAFDGRESTAGEMSVQEFKFDTPAALTKNAFEKTGYSFAGWATNIGAAATLSDGAVVSNLLATTKNETNTLHAVWTGHDYKVRFYGNGGLGEMQLQAFTYGVAQNLSSNKFVREGYDFAGWATDPTNDVAFVDGALVSDLTTTAGGRVALFAKWKNLQEVSELSVAADCDNLNLTTNAVGWTVEKYSETDEEKVGENDEYLRSDARSYLDAVLIGQGVLTFQYKVHVTNKNNLFYFYKRGADERNAVVLEAGNVEEWQTFTWTNTEQKACWLFSIVVKNGDYALLDNIKWVPDHAPTNWVGVTFRLNDGTSSPADVYENRTCQAGQPIGELPGLPDRDELEFMGWMTKPKGGDVIDANWEVPGQDVQLYAKWDDGSHPEPGPDDAVAVSAAKVADGKFTIEFKSSAVFDYLLMTNGDLSVKSWGERARLQGEGKAQTFAPEIDPAQPQLFYRIDTIQRQ